MPGRDQEPSFQLASGTTNERDNSYNISNTLGSIFYNTDTSNVEIRHEDPSNNVGWRDLVMNNKEQIDISGKLVVIGDASLNAHLSAVDASFQNNVDISGNLVVDGDVSFNGDLNMTGFNRKEVLLAGAGGLDGTGGAQGTATATSTLSAFFATLAFNGTLTDQNDVWHSSSDSLTNNPKSLIFEFPDDVIITKYKIWRRPLPHAGHNPKAWTLRAYEQGSSTSVQIDSLSNITNWPAPTSTSITNDTSFNEYPVANTTTAYRKFELKITESSHTGAVTIGELAFYGYRKSTINTGTLVVDGNVGIGTTTPSEKLEVNGNIKIERPGSGGANLTCQATGLNHHADINIVSVERANHPLHNFVGGFNKIRSIGNDGEGALAFIKMNNAGTSQVNTMLKLVQNGAYFGGPVYANGLILNGAGGATSSDDRIKENEKLIVNATETLSKLTPQIYDKYQTMDLSGSSIIESGLIAQEVYYNAPELRHLVTVGKDTDASGNEYTPTPEEMDLSGVDIGSDPDYGSHGWSKQNSSSLNYSGLIAYLIKSNQELVGRIDSLKTDISAIMTHLDLQQLTHIPPQIKRIIKNVLNML